MLRVFSVYLFLTIFQAVTSQIPENCRRPPPGGVTPVDCCKLPTIFTDEDYKECGIEKGPLPKTRGPEVCSEHVCILKRYNLMKDDDIVDREALAKFLDDWAKKNPEFKDAMEQTKKKCLDKELPGPPEICEANKIGFCTLVVTFDNCPTMVESAECNKLKEHMDSCKAFYPF
ncbi:general odorant-binding protein 66-like [Bicyclus anynana]|uniref:General odorant-binding protein 66-like n=1 Tax=Bicyclus anynana TaxID=110368 RepID=A0A6J1N079_BICAN|nr:general odorant-binding protein 66-like [Bicyclus anynana]